MDTITSNRLKGEWSSWLSEKSVDLLTEHPASGRRPDLRSEDMAADALTTTAYVRGGVGYKLLRRRLPGIRDFPTAWKFTVRKDVMMRDQLHNAVRLLETDRHGISDIFGGVPTVHAQRAMFGDLNASPCEEHIGPPPRDAEYAEIDWCIRRFEPDWPNAQLDAVVFGPLRVRRCVEGMFAMGHRDVEDCAEILGVPINTLHAWIRCGAPLVPDQFASCTYENFPTGIDTATARRVRPLLDLARFEEAGPIPSWWTAEAGAMYLRRVSLAT